MAKVSRQDIAGARVLQAFTAYAVAATERANPARYLGK